MALIQMGTVVTDIRNSIGGVTFSKNRGGSYARKKVSPVNTPTPAQAAVRANFGANAKLWSGTLTADQRQAWGFFAQANPLVNVFGNSILVSGLNMLMKLSQVMT